jgi:deoxyadenosine/deoxycytidine kinase
MIKDLIHILFIMIITIDGNIGSGKTSVLNYLHKTYKIPIDLEPVESWNSYLSKLYDDKLDVFKFQVRIWLDRCWIQEKSDKTTVLMERSPYFIRNAFIQSAYDTDMISIHEYNILMDLHKKTDNIWTSNTYIYLKSNPENCFKRIKKRNRVSEKNITEDYINMLHDYHEKTYKKALESNINIIVFEVDDKSIPDISNGILQFIQMKS